MEVQKFKKNFVERGTMFTFFSSALELNNTHFWGKTSGADLLVFAQAKY